MSRPEPTINRRHHERFHLQPMYSGVVARRIGGAGETVMEGHAYDISEGGLRLELDERLELGETLDVQLQLAGAERGVAAAASVVWVSDSDDDPRAQRMALRFTGFESDADHHRLVSYLGAGAGRVAA